MKKTPNEDTPRVLLLALGLWGLAASWGALQGVFARLAFAELAALSGFAFAFALFAAYADASLRSYLAAARLRTLTQFAIELDVGIAIGLGMAAGFSRGEWMSAMQGFPLAVAIVFALPLAGVAHVLLAQRLLQRKRVPVPISRVVGSR